ncbi:MAG TPA: ABC transporter permease [Longimicrobiales bacterium]|nr:ABC transporter permease [Longimicrobiales bacterium]
MGTIRELGRRASRLWRRGEQDRRLEEEVRFHLERETERNIARGMEPEAAHRAALLRFGGVERAKESARDEVRPALLEDLGRDVRFGVRGLLRSPGYAVVAVLTLGLGMGAATAVFSVVNGVLLAPLPYPEPDRIVRLFQLDKTGRRMGNASEPNFDDWKSRSHSFRAMAELQSGGKATVLSRDEPYQATIATVSREFFDVMGVRPALGRTFVAEEQRQGGVPAVVVSDAYWRGRLGARRDLGAETLTFEGRAYRVVGVMPPGFDFPQHAELWTARELEPPSPSRTAHNFQAIARLAPGVALDRARAELSAISRAMKLEYGDDTWMSDADVVSLRDQMTERVRRALFVLFGAAGVLLLIACANVSNLQLARAAGRGRELALRLALGAGRRRIARQLLAESLVLCLAAGALGAVLALGGVRLLLALEPGNLPRVENVHVSWAALGFTLVVALATAAALGLATSLRAGGNDLRGALAQGQRTLAGGRDGQRVRDALVVAQVALTLVLLAGAGLLGRSFLRLLAVDPGYRTTGAVVLDFALAEPGDDPSAPARQVRFQEDLLARLRNLPGVDEAGMVNYFPLGGLGGGDGTFIEMSRPDEITGIEDFARLMNVEARTGYADYRVASEGYFRAMRIPLIRGRLFEPQDGPDAPHVAVISQSLARSKWPNQDPIGKFVQFGNMDGDLRGLRIVGVVGDVREVSMETPPSPTLYSNSRQRPGAAHWFSVVVHGREDAATTAAARRIVRELDPRLNVNVRTIESAFDASLAGRRFSLVLIGVFAATALVLAAMGIYGVISYLVAQRTREIGIRIALGADAGDLVRLVLGRGAALGLAGTLVGLAVALAVTRLMAGLLFDVKAADPLAFTGVVALVAGVVLAASYVPARRATRVPPMIALRME